LKVLKATEANICLAADIVKKGGLVVYPTDTVYGLGCDPFNSVAVRRVCLVKGSRDKPLPVLACTVEDVERVAVVSTSARKIIEVFWPGPLTLVLPRKASLDLTTFDLSTIGVRVPNNDVALRLIRLSGGLLIGTSANKTSREPPSTAKNALRQLNNNVDVILDGGNTNLGISSTVLDLTGEKPQVLREGSLSLEIIEKSL
jgi:L-threonylcarbamoyladenylate synthase